MRGSIGCLSSSALAMIKGGSYKVERGGLGLAGGGGICLKV